MATLDVQKKKESLEILKIKSNILDELLEFIEDKYFALLMKMAEEEPNITLTKAKKLMK